MAFVLYLLLKKCGLNSSNIELCDVISQPKLIHTRIFIQLDMVSSKYITRTMLDTVGVSQITIGPRAQHV